jgi:PBP1b-binding outer membrane lipoprotein LpoB
MKTTSCSIITVLIVLALLMTGCVSMGGSAGDVRDKIKDTLVGTNLTYYSIAGQPMNYTIGPQDIGNIEPTTYKGKDAWKVRVGESLAWDLTMDANGTEILAMDQLFQT